MTGVRFVGPPPGDPAGPLGPNAFGRAMTDARAAGAQALAQALADMGRTEPRSPTALAKDLAAQAVK